MSPADFCASPLVGDLISRLHDLGLQSAFSQLSSANGGSEGRMLDSTTTTTTPFAAMSMSIRCPVKQFEHMHDASAIIDIFTPKSSASEIQLRSAPLFSSNQDHLFDAFIATRSRVVRVSVIIVDGELCVEQFYFILF